MAATLATRIANATTEVALDLSRAQRVQNMGGNAVTQQATTMAQSGQARSADQANLRAGAHAADSRVIGKKNNDRSSGRS
jgi:hypothetical protein